MNHQYDCSRVVDVGDEPRHQPVFTNEYVRALAVEIAPGDRTLCHRHGHDYVLYVVGSGPIVSAARDEEPKQLNYEEGECELLNAGLVHVVENLSDKPFRNVVVELLDGASGLRRGARPKALRGEPAIGVRIEQERVALFEIELDGSSEVEIVGPAVVAAISGARFNTDCGDVLVVPHKVFEFAWIPSGCEAVLWKSEPAASKVIAFQIGTRDDEAGSAVTKPREPLRSLRAEAEPE